MTIQEQVWTIGVIVVGTVLTRSLPFLLVREGSPIPEWIQYLSKVLPGAMIGLLVVYALKDTIGSTYYGIPEMIATVVLYGIHQWKSNMLLSLIVSTFVYMLLVQKVFL